MLDTRIPDYFDDAKKHSALFIDLLAHLKRIERSVPKSLEINRDIDVLLRQFPDDLPKGEGIAGIYQDPLFRIVDFRKGPFKCDDYELASNEAMLAYQVNDCQRTCYGAAIKFRINPNSTVEQLETLEQWIS